MTLPPAEFYRLDPLTGSNNFLSFVEMLHHLSSGAEKQSFSIIYIDMNYLEMLNSTRGHAYGDTTIRWLEIVLREESASATYRIGGDDFAVILTSGTRAGYEELLNRIFVRLNREGVPLGIPFPVAKIALIHYDAQDQFSLHDVIFHLWETMLDVKTNRDRTIQVYLAKDLTSTEVDAPPGGNGGSSPSQATLRWIANHAINRVIFMGKMLDDARRASLQDSISGLPNMRAALLKIEKEISYQLPFSILLMDGDELTRYNNISYAVGDEMIQKISAILSEKLRPGDFVARWRAGDEFIAVLPNTKGEGAKTVGERFCSAIRDASQTWIFPTSITVGIATYPKHGDNANTLVDAAEKALKRGKDEGKDRVIMAMEPEGIAQ